MEQTENKQKNVLGWLKRHALEIGLGAAAIGSLIYGLQQHQRAGAVSRELGRVLDDDLYMLGQIRAYEKEIQRLGRENANLNYQLGKVVSGELKTKS